MVSGINDGLLSKFVYAVSAMLPALENIKTTIEDSSKKIPKVSTQLSNVSQATESATVEILDVLDTISQNVDAAEAGLKTLGNLLPNPARPVTEVMSSISRSLATTKEKSMSIAMALQVQDITSQQIAGVSHMIESVRVELIRILDQFGGTAVAGPSAPVSTPAHFDIEAEYTVSTERQDQADQIVKQWTSDQP
ncbi:MAG TPA: hypothetical protein VMG09_06255 [Bacteroidota bacterium]|nr:hypothetical protein [Bacteroidota bacterium]